MRLFLATGRCIVTAGGGVLVGIGFRRPLWTGVTRRGMKVDEQVGIELFRIDGFRWKRLPIVQIGVDHRLLQAKRRHHRCARVDTRNERWYLLLSLLLLRK